MIGKLFSGARDREKFCHRRRSACDVHREVGIRKHAAANERRETGKQPESDHEAADKLDPTAQLTLQIIGAGHSAEHSENQLSAMLGEQESYNQSHDAVNRICKSIESVHDRSGCTMSILRVKAVAAAFSEPPRLSGAAPTMPPSCGAADACSLGAFSFLSPFVRDFFAILSRDR